MVLGFNTLKEKLKSFDKDDQPQPPPPQQQQHPQPPHSGPTGTGFQPPTYVSLLGSKRGLAWPRENPSPLTPHPFSSASSPSSKISWLYNWSPDPSLPPNSPFPFVPMVWNGSQCHVNSLTRVLDENREKCPQRVILGFNEPELHDQANMSPDEAANLWMDHMEPLRRSGIRVGSPGMSNAPQGMPWMRSFLSNIRSRGGDVDFWCLHWYGETLGQFYDYIWSTHHQLDASKPVWITEWAPSNWDEGRPLEKGYVEGFVRDACKYLDGLEWVERYCFFGAMNNTGTVGRHAAMLDNEGRLTEVGRIYMHC